MLISLLFYTFVVITSIQILYYLGFSFFAVSTSQKKSPAEKIPISVIICAKNEAKNLQKFLPSIVQQEYPIFEIVLINDASSDGSLEIMENFKKKNSNIKIVNVLNTEAFWGNKKYALTLGIKAATHKHLLFTDADCYIPSKKWIAKMASVFSTQKTIVLGYGKYKAKKVSLLNLLVRFETLVTAIQYFSYAKLKIPYMGVGRNLAYHKSEFYKTNGFIKHMHIRSGDDDLFIQEAASSKNTAICIDEDSFTISEAPQTFTEWFRQKRRHVSTASHYKIKFQLLLGLFFTTKSLFYALLIPLFMMCSWQLMIPISCAYFILLYLVIGFSAKKLAEPHLIFIAPFLELFLILFQFSIFITNLIWKPTHWK